MLGIVNRRRLERELKLHFMNYLTVEMSLGHSKEFSKTFLI